MENKKFIILVENYELHKEDLDKGPYIRHMDLALRCAQLVRKTNYEIIVRRITWDMLKQWDMSPEELFKKAEAYSKKEMSAVLAPMSTLIREFLLEEFLEIASNNPQKALTQVRMDYDRLFGCGIGDIPEMYVLSNELRIQGASTLFYDDILASLAEEKECNLILLPSSIHEWIILLETEAGSIDYLHHIVKDANCKVVEPGEILSNNVYRYLWKDHRVEILKGIRSEAAGR